MKIIKYLSNLTKAVAASRTAQVCFFLHLVILIFALIQKGTIQPIHWEYEFLLYKILTIFNLLASLISALLTLPLIFFFSLFVSELPPINQNGSHPFIIFAYIGWQIQAALIGYGIEKLLNRWRSMK